MRLGVVSLRRRSGEAGVEARAARFDEEDEYDKVALGKEDGGKGVSMEDAISRPCGVRIRDPCANHAAAKMRLKEDELEANK
ncbi:BnaC01g37670D [Brassica napus]|uniref:BnaC01g37670D protein n=2 Tax=Brassica TaxID=3705 RepID=A0A078GGB1_BRANA|nr:BnaC01g37670D [Brassica napus]